ncbi:hypothetical protein BFP97_18335 [Roseivirga sp. 4D4]|uniref:hypothetical protein n=1 Tax=Roseivirga sp. 4D4 TaxID=1889784 RepID=UPI000852B614|nr:hypothetical protein [Roseivirga sp. 4D4]OEK03360.1 hypothetical protein BFP97_18335 [Roseivirga sp. 4D4]
MSPVAKVLVKTIVKEFYKENAGFFLVILGLGFGFLKTPQHIDIASALAFRPIYYLIPMVLWILYTLKTLNFFSRIKRLPQNRFLTSISGLENKRLKPLVVFIQLLLLIPILGYGIFMTIIAIGLQQTYSALILVVSNVFLLMVAAHFLFLQLVKPIDPKTSSFASRRIGILPKTYPFLPIHHLFQRHSISLILTKLFSIGLILGATAIFNMEGVDLRYLALGTLLSSAIHANFSYRHYEFEMSSLLLYRNLPMPRVKSFGQNALTYIILSIPEFLVFFGNNIQSVAIVDLVQIALIIPVISVLHHAMIKHQAFDLEGYFKYIFFLTAFLFFVILGYVPIYLLEIILLAVALALASRSDTSERAYS